MKYIDNDIRRQHLRLVELQPLVQQCDPHNRTLSLHGAKLLPGHERFIDFALSKCKIPDLFLDCSSKHWSVVIGLDVVYTLFQFLDGKITTSDGEYISDLPYWASERFRWLELEMSAINPGAKDRETIISILKTSYDNREGQNP